MASLSAYFYEFAKGLRDSLLGFVKIGQLDAAQAAAVDASKAKQSSQRERESVLRNAESTTSLNSLSSTSASSSALKRSKRPKLTVNQQRFMQQRGNQSNRTVKEIEHNQSATLIFIKCVFSNVIPVAILFLLQLLNVSIESFPVIESILSVSRQFFTFILFIFIRFISSLWFSDISKAAVKLRKSPPPSALANGQTMSLYDSASEFVFSTFIETVVLIEAMALYSLPFPILNEVLGFVFMSLLNSFYSFGYLWGKQSTRLATRVQRVENHWPYYIGFGFILTALTSLSESFVVNGFIFAALFPFFIISSCAADTPTDQGALPLVTVPVFSFTERLCTFFVKLFQHPKSV